MVLCSDKLSKINQPIIKLALSLTDIKPDIYFEMNRTELDEFIYKLETIQKVLLFFLLYFYFLKIHFFNY